MNVIAEQVAALQEFEQSSKRLPIPIKAKLINAFDGTPETTGRIMAFARLYDTIIQVMNADLVADARAKLAAEGVANATAPLDVVAALAAKSRALLELAHAYAGTPEQSAALAAATRNFRSAVVTELAALRAGRTAP